MFAIFRPATPELGGTALVVTGAAMLVIALLDRVPRRFAAGGVVIDFSDDDARIVLETIASESPDVFDEIAAIVRRSASPAAAERVQRLITDAAATKPASGPVVATPTLLPTLTPRTEAEVLNVLAAQPGFRREVAVPVPSGARPPIADVVFAVEDVTVENVAVDAVAVAVAVKSAWNDVIARATDDTLRRILRSTEVTAAAVVVPSSAVARAESTLSPEIVVCAWEDVASLPERVRALRA